MIIRSVIILGVVLLCNISGPVARAQQAAPAATGAAPKSAQSEAGEPRVRSKETGQGGDKAADKRIDRVELDTTTVTGNRELPKVMYVVPWKKSDIGDLVGKPMNSLLDEVLAPVDRDVFRREVTYYNAVNTGAGQNSARPAPPSGQGEK